MTGDEVALSAGCGAAVDTTLVPCRATVCGVPAGSSEMLSVPVLVPFAPGLKVTEMVQFAPASRVVPQVLVWVNSPLVVMLEIGTGVSPGLVRVTL